MTAVRGVVVALLAVVLAACGSSAPATAAPPVTVRPGAPGMLVGGLDGASAAAVLAVLPVRDRDPLGYRREAFGPAWADVDRNRCDTRNDVLRRDLADEAVRPDGCTVESGVLRDPYTGAELTFTRGAATSSAVQIDHVVSLADAYRSGAHAWTPEQRVAFANNPAGLLAVKGSENTRKGDRRADEYLPPRAEFRCRYAAIQVAVKAAPGPDVPPLSVSVPERDALAAVLARCGGEPAKGAP